MAKENETKICKYCQSEIPRKAKVCPNCRKRQGGGCLRIVLIVVIVFVVLIVIGSLAGSDDDTATPTDSESGTGVVTETENASSTIGVGDSFEENNLKITVNSYNNDYTDYASYYEPDDGYKYIEINFTYENTGDSGDKYVSIYDCACYADNSSCEQAYIGGEDFINENISAGRNVTFNVYFTVPTDAESIELEYETNVWTDEKVIISLQ